jgi:hypothetical protein
MSVSIVRRSKMPWSGLMFGLLLLACGDPKKTPTPSVGSNSNWLKGCETDSDCGGKQDCQCGTCSLPCSDEDACNALADATCAKREDPALTASCGFEAATAFYGRCLPRCEAGSCGDGQACVDGACVLATIAETPFCDDVAEASAPQRRQEDRILALVLEQRASGSEMCTEEEPVTTTVAGLRVDPRLTCAARVIARETNERGGPGEDRERTTEERLRAAGYEAELWGLNFAMRAETAEEALRLMHNDRDTCRRFSDARFRDVGVANDGDTYIVTIAVER